MCEREPEVIDSLRSGRVDPDLHAHATECASCAELIEIAGSLIDDRQTLMQRARIPGSGLMWWRTTMRARRVAAQRAIRTAWMIQAALVLAALGGGIAWMGPPHIDAQAILGALSAFAIPLIALAAFLILAPAAVYLVFSKE